MKLLECYVENFGKLSKFAYHFKGDMNIFLHENGWGKTTFSAFLKAMLYGLGSSRSPDISQNERLRYTPWQGGKFGGTLTFSDGEGTYRIERTFGARESEDTFALYDCHTGRPSTKYSRNLGEDLFGIDAMGYERSTFISERLTSEGGTKDYSGIQAKLVDMNDLSDYEIAVKRLDKSRQKYQMTGNRGRIGDTERRISELRMELRDAEDALNKTNELRRKAQEFLDRIHALEEEQSSLRGRHERILESSNISALLAHKDTLVENHNRAKEKVSACRAYLSGNIPTVAVAEEHLALSRAMEEQKRSEPSVKPMPKSIFILMVILGAICLVAGIVAGQTQPIFYLVGSLLGAILMGLGGCLIYMAHRTQEILRTAKSAQVEQERRKKAIAQFLSGFPIVMADTSLSTDKDRLWAIRSKLDDLRRAQQDEVEAEASLETFRTSHPDLFIEGGIPQKAEEADILARLEEIQRQVNALRESHLACEREIAQYSARASRYAICAQEIANLDAKRSEYIKHLEIIQATQQFLLTARTALTNKYHNDIQIRFRHYMQLLTQEDKGSIFSDEYAVEAYSVTPDFQVNITKFATTHSAASMSRGGRDLIALCLRFAICDALFGKENPPLILDDPFINLDDEKIAAAMRLLSKISEERQILYLSCHSSRT